jgi:CRISPR-associated protein Csy2
MSPINHPHRGVLLIPKIRVQNANAISSPLTWGFPAITAFTGLLLALERRLGPDEGIQLLGVGVVCHDFDAQVTTEGYTRTFHLTRNPVLQNGASAAIVEEGRVHLEISLVFDVRLADKHRGDANRESLATRIAEELSAMRLAGGSVMPALPTARRRTQSPVLALVPDDTDIDEARVQLRRLSGRLLPGFALVSRDDLLQQRLLELRVENSNATLLDAWLELSSWTSRASKSAGPSENFEENEQVEWIRDARPGWIVPIPVGFTSLSELHPGGSVAGARDSTTPFRFVETIWSIGQWVSLHRIHRLGDLFWMPDYEQNLQNSEHHALYRCVNNYSANLATTSELS